MHPGSFCKARLMHSRCTIARLNDDWWIQVSGSCFRGACDRVSRGATDHPCAGKDRRERQRKGGTPGTREENARTFERRRSLRLEPEAAGESPLHHRQCGRCTVALRREARSYALLGRTQLSQLNQSCTSQSERNPIKG